MRFALTDDQVALRDAVRELLAKRPPDASATYDALVAMGVTSVLVPEADGGLGMDEVTAVAILEETGYVALEHPILEATMGDDSERLALGAAAQLVGLGQRMLDLTVDYAKQREQFGVPIGSFQAVKHHLADALKELAFSRPAVRRAAATMDPVHISMAKAMASDAAGFSARQALQCHGAIGYTVEHDLHRYLKRTWTLARTHGDAAWRRERIARAAADARCSMLAPALAPLATASASAAGAWRREPPLMLAPPGDTVPDERFTMTEAFIVDAVRTPVGRRGGGLSQVHPADLGAHPLPR